MFYLFQLRQFFLITFFLLLSNILFAQFGPPPTDSDQNGDSPGVPIDGGATILLFAGAIYGGKKIIQRKRS